MDIFEIIQNQMGIFLLVLTRISGIFIMSPFLGSRNIPMVIRVGCALAISLVLFPVLSQESQSIVLPQNLIIYTLVIFSELFVGWIIGFVASLAFSAIHMAGQLLDMQIGFGVVNVLDPTSGQQVPIVGSFKYNLATIVFLVSNSHHMLLSSLFDSFHLIPVMGAHIKPEIVTLIVDMIWAVFVIAIKISIPILVAIILTDVGLGILARTMPQMNIFVVGIPAKIFVGLFVLSFALPFYIIFLDVLFNEMFGNIYVVLRFIS
ncbi:flagellar biosynthetic protein FliR [Anaerosinus sp.]|uniref:flagellar biosynthetic protein FliR n=1 Tax=Selenobaculum sp. TaxID=3074374 RepID=UPI0015AA2A18